MHPVGIFDSGYGGLTVMKEIVKALPQYDYMYLGDNKRAPYGSRDFDQVYHYTWQAVKWLLDKGCPLVVLACNTASAKALRTIQQHNLPTYAPDRRVLGVIRPTTEVIGNYSATKHVGILGTTGTVQSESYLIEIKKFFPDLNVSQEACPLWVPLIENGEINTKHTGEVIKNNLDQILKSDPFIDTILLACTHYPLVEHRIADFLNSNIRVVSQGKIVAESLRDYLQRHPEIKNRISTGGKQHFFTTGEISDFDMHSSIFFDTPIHAEQVILS